MRQRSTLLPLILFFTFIVFSTEARADSVIFNFGTRVGTFGSTSNATSQGLSFTPSVGGGSAKVGVGSSLSLSTGFFVLSSTTAIYSDTFNLQFSILNPQGASPISANFLANVSGQVSNGTGSIAIDFQNNTQTFIFEGADGNGVFTLTLPDKIITNFGTENFLPVQMNLISVTHPPVPVPEPTTIVLLGTGLAGFIGTARRRGNAKS